LYKSKVPLVLFKITKLGSGCLSAGKGISGGI
jgi:hypothetical protein